MKKFLCLFLVMLFAFPTVFFAEESVEDKVDRTMKKYIGKDIPGAAIAIVQDGKVVLLKGYGQSDLEKGTAVDAKETVFEAASVSKVFTWSAVMQLVEEGKIDLEEDIRTYLPKDFLELTFDDKVTMQHLMNHTAGFEDKASQLLTTNPEEMISLAEFASKVNQPEQVFRPGEVISYSNYGTTLAGYIVERVSGQPFTTYMQEHVLGKLKMTNSTFEQQYDDMKQIVNGKGKGYEKLEDTFKEVDRVYINDAPAGSLNTTAEDMIHFMLAHLQSEEYKLFDDERTLQTMHEQTYAEHPELPGNAHGFWERYQGGERIIEHGGNLVGYTSQLMLIPEKKFGMMLLMNVANEATGLRVDLINELIGTKNVESHSAPSENDDLVQGTYRMARGIYSNFLKFLPIIGNGDVVVKKSAEGGIDVQMPYEKKSVHYAEIEPFLYEKVNQTVTFMDKNGFDTNRIYFTAQDGQIVKMSYGVVSDLLPVKMTDRAMTNIIVLAITMLTLLSYVLFFIIHWLKRKIKKDGRKTTTAFRATALLTFAGIIVFIDMAVLLSRFVANPFQPLSPLRIHLWGGWLLPIATIGCAYIILKQFKETSLKGKVFQLWLLLVSTLLSFLLWNYHFLF
ncbi:hypothetical protein CEW92_08550 [Bacillaceae bacterium SAS-127]|nr:hypothetical protein CEW92_08550 [Bacillaceae bacterium SAS-127]